MLEGKSETALSDVGHLDVLRSGYQPSPIMKHFVCSELPLALQEIAKPICDMAGALDRKLPNGPEKSVGLRKLLEAMDALLRATA